MLRKYTNPASAVRNFCKQKLWPLPIFLNIPEQIQPWIPEHEEQEFRQTLKGLPPEGPNSGASSISGVELQIDSSCKLCNDKHDI